MHIYPYNSNSESSKALATGLGIKRAKRVGALLKTDTLINWGSSSIDREIETTLILNEPEAVAIASNKLETFKILDKVVAIPLFTESREEALKWLAEGATVVARTVLTGHSGKGIVIVNPDDNNDELPMAKLYTKYIPKTEEYRIHVVNGKIIHSQRKARNKDVPDDQVNWKVRNHSNGFIFAHFGIAVNDKGEQAAISAVKALGLDFGAVDLIYNRVKNMFYVLEVNTACGLEGETLKRYVQAFKELT